MILVVFRTVLLVQRPRTNLWKGRFINTNYYIIISYTAHVCVQCPAVYTGRHIDSLYSAYTPLLIHIIDATHTYMHDANTDTV